ncbi:glycosyltransferase family 4 protein [Algoriphagus aestuariicola]|jgi:glycosyltransferase involved in cell wall biosynthesis|uniref:Glycosyltransferase family 4 protein n=1 Tax=Algoriphagus aestuariicola TaxID=1852016 RepID=A0ABS3BNU1_9BACT|nr:glycosyltransferase family 4 protein [Algoriphagus aestuariicola]MBN7799911.1 glycosyltransferase family 4 protein [Algoriphagus aestuariicola]
MDSLLIITCVQHIEKDGIYYAYGPYVREMNLWIQSKEVVTVLAPVVHTKSPGKIDIAYSHPNLRFRAVPAYHVQSWPARFCAIWQVPLILFKMALEMSKASQIHIRIPGNMGLLGMFVQVLFPNKPKVIKYAGNWDSESSQPLTFKIQRNIANSTFLTKNSKVLVYGNWPDSSSNVVPLFTASYRAIEAKPVAKSPLGEKVKLAFVGAIYSGKNPETGIHLSRLLKDRGIDFEFTYCGDGVMREEMEKLSQELGVSEQVVFLGNVTADDIKRILGESHFLIFISRTEGWPKAVAEAMFWGCVPFTSAVSCVPEMVGRNQERGVLLENDPAKILSAMLPFLEDEELYLKTSRQAMEWSREFTLEKFQEEIAKLG